MEVSKADVRRQSQKHTEVNSGYHVYEWGGMCVLIPTKLYKIQITAEMQERLKVYSFKKISNKISRHAFSRPIVSHELILIRNLTISSIYENTIMNKTQIP